MNTIEKDAETINYGFWKARKRAESSDIGLIARQALFDADQARLGAIYDDEFDREYLTGEKTLLQPGAISQYTDAFEKFAEVLRDNPTLGKTSPYADEIIDQVTNYRTILQLTGRDWPRDFPLQDLIDIRFKQGFRDSLPTTADLEDMLAPINESESDDPASNTVDESEGDNLNNSDGNQPLETESEDNPS